MSFAYKIRNLLKLRYRRLHIRFQHFCIFGLGQAVGDGCSRRNVSVTSLSCVCPFPSPTSETNIFASLFKIVYFYMGSSTRVTLLLLTISVFVQNDDFITHCMLIACFRDYYLEILKIVDDFVDRQKWRGHKIQRKTGWGKFKAFLNKWNFNSKSLMKHHYWPEMTSS